MIPTRYNEKIKHGKKIKQLGHILKSKYFKYRKHDLFLDITVLTVGIILKKQHKYKQKMH